MSDFDHWVAHLKSPRVHHVLDIHASILDTAFLYAQSVIILNGICSSQGNDIYFKLQRSENDMIVILCSFSTQGRGTNFLVDNLFLTPTRRADVWPLVFNTSSLAAIILGPPGQRCHASSVFTRKTLFKVYARNAPGQHTYLSQGLPQVLCVCVGELEPLEVALKKSNMEQNHIEHAVPFRIPLICLTARIIGMTSLSISCLVGHK